MGKVTKKLSDYLAIYNSRTDATIDQLAEAATFFESCGSKFKSQADDLKKEIKKFTQLDMFSQLGVNSATYTFDGNDYKLAEVTTSKKIVGESNLMAMQSDPDLAPYLIRTVSLDKDKLFADKENGTLPASLQPYVQITKQVCLGLRKQAKK